MNLRDIEAQAKALAPILRDFVVKAVAALGESTEKRLDEMEQRFIARLDNLPSPKDGIDGIDGKDAEAIPLETVETMVSEAVKSAFSAIPVPKDGENGKDGLDGKDADAIPYDVVEKMVADAVEKAVAALPKAKDGIDGKDALQIEVLPYIDIEKSYPRGTYGLAKGGLFRAYQSTVGEKGWECVINGVHEHAIEQVNERNIEVVCELSNGRKVRKRMTMPTMIYRNVWKEGNYQKGDVVTWGGCVWHCDADTDTKPGDGAKHWTLAVKKGRDGKSA